MADQSKWQLAPRSETNKTITGLTDSRALLTLDTSWFFLAHLICGNMVPRIFAPTKSKQGLLFSESRSLSLPPTILLNPQETVQYYCNRTGHWQAQSEEKPRNKKPRTCDTHQSWQKRYCHIISYPIRYITDGVCTSQSITDATNPCHAGLVPGRMRNVG